MKIKDKIKSYSFWVSLASAVILILKVVGSRFGFTVDESMVSDAFTALCSILVLLGIIVVPSSQDKTNQTQEITDLTQSNNQTDKFETETKDLVQTFKTEQENNQEPDLNSEAIQENNVDTKKDIVQVEAKVNDLITDNLTQPETSNVEITSNLETKIQDEVLEIETQDIRQETETQYIPEITIQEVVTQDFNESKSYETTQEVDSFIQCQEQVFNEPLNNEINQTSISKETNIVEDLKNLFTSEREKFANNINDYILELQEELRKARERM